MKTKCFLLATVLIIASMLSSQLYAAQVNFTPSVVVSEEYTDNLFRDSDDEEEDFITSTGINLAGEVLWQTAGLSLVYRPTYRLYADNSDLDSWRHNANLLAWKEYRRNTRFEFRNNFLFTEDPGDSSDDDDRPSGVDPSIEEDRNREGRDQYYQNLSEARINHRFGADDQVFGGLRYRLFRDVDLPSGEESDDYDFWEPFLGMDYWFNVRWGVQIEGEYSNRDFRDRVDREEYTGITRLRRRFTRHFNMFIEYKHTYLDFKKEEGDNSDYNLYAPSAGLQYQLEENANIRLGAGYYYQDTDGDENEEGYFVNADVFKRWPFRRGYVTLTGGSGYDVDDDGSEDLGLNIFYTARVAAGYDFTRHLSGNVFTSYRYDDFPNNEENRSDQTARAGAGLDYQALRWMNLRLEYNFSDLRSDDDDDEYTENSVLFTVSIAPSQPFRLNR